MVGFRFVLSRVCVFLYSLGPMSAYVSPRCHIMCPDIPSHYHNLSIYVRSFCRMSHCVPKCYQIRYPCVPHSDHIMSNTCVLISCFLSYFMFYDGVGVNIRHKKETIWCPKIKYVITVNKS